MVVGISNTPLLTDIESKQISQEIVFCLSAGMTSWDILRALRTMRKAMEDGVGFTLERRAEDEAKIS